MHMVSVSSQTGSGLGGGSIIHAQSAEYGQLFDRPFGLPYV